MQTVRSLSDLLTPARVAVHVEATTKAEALAAAVALVAGDEAVRDAARLAADVEARESVLSTGVGEGLALPHARTSAVTATVGALVTLATPVDWDAIDGAPVDLVVFFAGPENERGAHIRLLAAISKTLSKPGCRRELAEAASATDVMETLG